jgi:hypothetical protein
MPAIDGVKVDLEPDALFDKLKANHAARENVAYSKRRFVGDALQQLLGVFALRCVNEGDGTVRFVVGVHHRPDIERATAAVLVRDAMCPPRDRSR